MRAAYVRLLANNGTVLHFNGGRGGGGGDFDYPLLWRDAPQTKRRLTRLKLF